jgi:hypothetical protein
VLVSFSSVRLLVCFGVCQYNTVQKVRNLDLFSVFLNFLFRTFRQNIAHDLIYEFTVKPMNLLDYIKYEDCVKALTLSFIKIR